LFVKPGVGVLKRDEMNYNHSRPYVIANSGKWDVKTARNLVEFTHALSEPSIEFGYVYTKVVRLTPGKPQMTIAHVMRHTGSKPIATDVYDHNLTTIDRQPIGPDGAVTVPWQMTRAAASRTSGRARVFTLPETGRRATGRTASRTCPPTACRRPPWRLQYASPVCRRSARRPLPDRIQHPTRAPTSTLRHVLSCFLLS
jgi:hypothetical protein